MKGNNTSVSSFYSKYRKFCEFVISCENKENIMSVLDAWNDNSCHGVDMVHFTKVAAETMSSVDNFIWFLSQICRVYSE